MDTFVVRVWSEEGAGEGLRGVVRHVRTGREARFADALQLADLLTRGLPPDASSEALSPPGSAPR